jgi:hypothetical protein
MVARNVKLTRRTQLVRPVIAWSYFPASRSRADARNDCCCTRRQWAYNACLVREIVEITYTLLISLNTKAVIVRTDTRLSRLVLLAESKELTKKAATIQTNKQCRIGAIRSVCVESAWWEP